MGAAEILDSGGAPLHVGLCSLGLLKLKSLPTFLGLPNARFEYALAANASSFDVFIGWGRKLSGVRATRLSQHHNKRCLLLEDGFLRSVHPNSVVASPALSLVIDDAGIFYDAAHPSRLENLIVDAALNDPTAAASGAEIINTLREGQLCKYNDFTDDMALPLGRSAGKTNVLVIDQTAGDLSVAGAGADETDFRLMLEAARDENPGARILIKSHPETVAGKRNGYLSDAGDKPGCQLITERCNPWTLFDQVDRVYAVSSQLGFDALMAGKLLRCFGMPFYAGWGLSDDQKSCGRRLSARPTLEQVAAATYNRYCRYLDPFTDTLTTFSATVKTLAHLKQVAQTDQSMGPLLHIYPWNHKAVCAMFQLPCKKQNFFASSARAIQNARIRRAPVAAWSARIKPELVDRCKSAGVALHRIEDGFVRSVGLGSNFHQPMSLILDKTGIYYDANTASDLETLLATHTFDDELLARARKLIVWLTTNSITKYNLAARERIEGLPQDRLKILVPGQVEDDASVLHSGSQLKSSVQLLRAVREANPNAFIIFKPHPDVVSGQRPGLWQKSEAMDYADLFVQDVPIVETIAACDQIHVLSSLAGFEGLLRGKQVTCYGLPFYAGWGLTFDVLTCERRKRRLSIEELVAGSVILYPYYLDPVTQLPCSPEVIINRILEHRLKPKRPGALVASRELLGYFRRTLRRVQE
ncbi:MAG: capsular polysaccharide biosynthesis protein [Rhizobiales bacterium]|nr:capsular polysaccharide biosynthesis protein [Hyphomicrobiales bacterium]